MALNGMSQREMIIDRVVIVSTDSLSFYNAGFFEFSNDSLHSSLSDSNLQSDLPESHFRVLKEQHQNVRVVRQKGPARCIFCGRDLNCAGRPNRNVFGILNRIFAGRACDRLAF